MADKRCFVQFPHPKDERKPDRDGKTIGWNKSCTCADKSNPHKRKFMQLRGEWRDGNDRKHTGDLRAWGEWEPESDLVCENDPHHPRFLWCPYWVPKDNYRGLHNTDPFIFGERFLYSNCRQTAQAKKGLKHLAQGSVIAFGSGKKIAGKRKWVLDTVFVIADSIEYNPLDPPKALKGRVSETFLSVTGGPLTACA